MEPISIIKADNRLGEGITWDDGTGALWWTDIEEKKLYRMDWESQGIRTFDTPERVGSFGLTDVPGCLVTAFETGFALYWPESGEVLWFGRPAEHTPGVRFNDGRVDPQGRFWSGTMVETAGQGLKGALYRLSADGTTDKVEDGVVISNGLSWSPDGATLYFADSPRQKIYAYDYDVASGTTSNRRVFASLTGDAYPDGACMDAEGGLWSATWASHTVRRYLPDGSLDRMITLPVSQPSCTTLGGPGLNLLFVTSAKQGLSDDVLKGEPLAGSVFVYDVGVRGLPEPRFPARRHINQK
ncbi:SMP-30/gluconolactonase/LRE family protein [Kordiimonas marina]|uniref:SMP-30/gluconolactonase/LRE family protein n=1 Tax=Kordiimonas marina TaxID=2872312 RepID=UPI001FF55313|nr:SMP-30/gluconolactonase/LRE family protein [Kordiimonas marina]MCJ9427860.1 SMP-30/gluconolactonase/LRE family protein [Kordiimonas marina]